MKYMGLLVLAGVGALAWAVRPAIKYGDGYGDRPYQYVEVAFPKVGFQIDVWRVYDR